MKDEETGLRAFHAPALIPPSSFFLLPSECNLSGKEEIPLSCYFRHMKDVLDEVGVTITPENKKEIDRILHGIVGVDYKNCPPAWKAIKEMVKGAKADREKFIEKLKNRLAG